MTVQVTPVSDGTRRFSSEMAFVAEGLGTSNVHTKKKFDNILALTGPEELNDDYVNVYSTCALVGALVMSFLAPAASARPSVDSHSNIWVISISWAVCTALSMVTIKNKTLELIRERAS
eukprot:Stramenopile-MAST_4_protein_4033